MEITFETIQYLRKLADEMVDQGWGSHAVSLRNIADDLNWLFRRQERISAINYQDLLTQINMTSYVDGVTVSWCRSQSGKQRRKFDHFNPAARLLWKSLREEFDATN